jgi:hypothetical protein
VQDATKKYNPAPQTASRSSRNQMSAFSSNRGLGQLNLLGLGAPPSVSSSVRKWMDNSVLANAPGSTINNPRGRLRVEPPPVDQWLNQAEQVQAPGTNLRASGISYDIPNSLDRRQQPGIPFDIAGQLSRLKQSGDDYEIDSSWIRSRQSEISYDVASLSVTQSNPNGSTQRVSSRFKPTRADSAPFLLLNPPPFSQNSPHRLVPRGTSFDTPFRALSSPKLLPRRDTNSQAKPQLLTHEFTEIVPRTQLQARGSGSSRSQPGYLPPNPFETKCPKSLSRFCSAHCDCDFGNLECTHQAHSSPYSSKYSGGT